MTRQFFYLVVRDYDECTAPLKIFLQKSDAVRFGRREATKSKDDGNIEFHLYRQQIARTAELEYVGQLRPYTDKPVVNPFVDFDWGEFEKEEGV